MGIQGYFYAHVDATYSHPHQKLWGFPPFWRLEEDDLWTAEALNNASREVAEAFGVNHKKVIMPLLFGSLMGKRKGPPLFDSVPLLGKDRTRARLLKTIDFLGGISNKKMKELQTAWVARDCKELLNV